ncbi:hypothetical protein FHS43_006796 [Streptosporangium becharense]|uniref:Uncharacterized protein n=1 Tax=Streptosporangium becharense TaxID=1816182 RepID=A0A7W9IHT5_9ACTN|nr:hypothetical protein [Streptosporangium becharense]MBB2915475.1 hypothetical protein [Streptosporangium becharense]MBB5820980.1 hypothetical protein [Streptosporangium becharense]
MSSRMHRYFGRLGIRDLIRDHLNTLYEFGPNNKIHASWPDIALFYVLPVGVGIFFWIKDAQLYVSDVLLSGIAVLTGFLFGLLVHVFSVGVKVADDPRYGSGDRLPILIDELRANVSYSCGVGLLITVLLIFPVAFMKPEDLEDGLSSGMAGLFSTLFTHLILTLLMVVKRVRSAYKVMAK